MTRRLLEFLVYWLSPRGIRRFLPMAWVRVRRFFLTRLPLKIVSLGLAVLLWNAINTTGTAPEGFKTVTVPIRVLLPSVGVCPWRIHLGHSDTQVRLRGRPEVLSSLRPQDLRVFIDAMEIRRPGWQVIVPRTQLPEGVYLAQPVGSVELTVEAVGPAPSKEGGEP